MFVLPTDASSVLPEYFEDYLKISPNVCVIFGAIYVALAIAHLVRCIQTGSAGHGWFFPGLILYAAYMFSLGNYTLILFLSTSSIFLLLIAPVRLLIVWLRSVGPLFKISAESIKLFFTISGSLIVINLTIIFYFLLFKNAAEDRDPAFLFAGLWMRLAITAGMLCLSIYLAVGCNRLDNSENLKRKQMEMYFLAAIFAILVVHDFIEIFLTVIYPVAILVAILGIAPIYPFWTFSGYDKSAREAGLGVLPTNSQRTSLIGSRVPTSRPTSTISSSTFIGMHMRRSTYVGSTVSIRTMYSAQLAADTSATNRRMTAMSDCRAPTKRSVASISDTCAVRDTHPSSVTLDTSLASTTNISSNASQSLTVTDTTIVNDRDTSLSMYPPSAASTSIE